MLKPFLILSALVLTGAFAQSPQVPQAGRVPRGTRGQNYHGSREPRSTLPNLLPLLWPKQRKIYGYECAICHGDDGSGAGNLAKNMKSKIVIPATRGLKQKPMAHCSISFGTARGR